MNQFQALTLDLKNSIPNDQWGIQDQSTGFQLISDNFQFKGSKIDWSKTKQHWSHRYKHEPEISLIEKSKVVCTMLENQSFIENIKNQPQLHYVSDSAIDVEMVLCGSCFMDFLSIILKTLNQHHYFVSSKGDWCLCIASEGFLDFGFSITA